MIQTFLGLVVVFLVYLVGRTFLSETGLLYAIFLVAFDPSLANMQMLILTESLFTVLLISVVYVSVKVIQDPFVKYGYFFAGMLVALATLVRPVSYFLFPLILLFFVGFQLKKGLDYRKVLYHLALLAVPFLLFVGGWQLRNYMVAGGFELSRITGINLLFYNAAGVVAEEKGISLEQAQEELGYHSYRRIHPEVRGLSDMKLNSRLKREALHIILKHPLIYFKVHVRGMRNFLISTRLSSMFVLLGKYQHGRISRAFREMKFFEFLEFVFSKGLVLFLMTLSNLIWFAAMFGPILFCFLFRTNVPGWDEKAGLTIFYLVLICVYFLVISGGPPGGARLKSPIIPLLSLLSGCGLQLILEKFRKWKMA